MRKCRIDSLDSWQIDIEGEKEETEVETCNMVPRLDVDVAADSQR